METVTLNLTKEELSFLCDALAEIHGEYNNDGTISLFGNEHRGQMVQELGGKLEEAGEQLITNN